MQKKENNNCFQKHRYLCKFIKKYQLNLTTEMKSNVETSKWIILQYMKVISRIITNCLERSEEVLCTNHRNHFN